MNEVKFNYAKYLRESRFHANPGDKAVLHYTLAAPSLCFQYDIFIAAFQENIKSLCAHVIIFHAVIVSRATPALIHIY
jgi:hypothetical protein